MISLCSCASAQVGWSSNQYVRPFAWGQKSGILELIKFTLPKSYKNQIKSARKSTWHKVTDECLFNKKFKGISWVIGNERFTFWHKHCQKDFKMIRNACLFIYHFTSNQFGPFMTQRADLESQLYALLLSSEAFQFLLLAIIWLN